MPGVGRAAAGQKGLRQTMPRPFTKTPRNSARKPLRTLTAAAPLALTALTALLLSAAPADAGVGATTIDNPRVTGNGSTLTAELSTTITDQSTDNAVAQNVADSFLGSWGADVISYALQNSPPRVSTCQATVTATDPDGATGTATTTVPTGTTTQQITLRNQTPGATWRVGDSDRFATRVVCTDTGNGAQVTTVSVDQEETAG